MRWASVLTTISIPTTLEAISRCCSAGWLMSHSVQDTCKPGTVTYFLPSRRCLPQRRPGSAGAAAKRIHLARLQPSRRFGEIVAAVRQRMWHVRPENAGDARQRLTRLIRECAHNKGCPEGGGGCEIAIHARR
jgi:hypothetical protein